MDHLPVDFNRYQMQQSYTDLNQLNQIRELGQEDQSLALRQIAQQFESIFVSLMLQSMRSANDVFAQDNPLNSFEMGFHRDMYDQQLSLSLSQGGRIGLADAFFRQMKSTYPGSNNLSSEGLDHGFGDGLIDSQRVTSGSPYTEPIETIVQRRKDSDSLNSIRTPEEFVKIMMPFAQEIGTSMGVDPKGLVAQTALETGWGEYVTKDSQGNHSFNLFNIKADKRWDGHLVKVPTIEYRDGVAQREVATFRRYDSIQGSFNDYQKFLQQPRYEKALSVADNSEFFLQELQKAGYATDPEYANKISRILKDL